MPNTVSRCDPFTIDTTIAPGLVRRYSLYRHALRFNLWVVLLNAFFIPKLAVNAGESVLNEPHSFPDHIYKSYFPRFVSFFRRHVTDPALAEDLAAITLNNAARNWHHLKTPESPGAWLWKIARNVLLTHVRDQNRDKRKGKVVPIDALETSPDLMQQPDLERAFIAREQFKRVKGYIESLLNPLRITVELYFLRDHDLNEVAALMNLPVGTVKSRINKFRKGLRDWEQAQNPVANKDAADDSSSSRSNT